MKLNVLIGVSFLANAALAGILLFSKPAVSSESEKENSAPAAMSAKRQPATPLAETNSAATMPGVVPWALIESEDYARYIANLRAVECPDWLVRDIIVAEIDDLYQRKAPPLPEISPWWNADRRRVVERKAASATFALKVEKRALVRELLGYEWDSHANEIWNEDATTSMLLGFMPDMKATQLLSLVEKYHEAELNVRERVKTVLLAEDRAKLESVYNGFLAESSTLLSPIELEEYQLRMQAFRFFPAFGVAFDGVSINDFQLRDVARLSRSVKDMIREEFSEEKVTAEQLEQRQAAFEAALKKKFDPQLYSELQRAHDTRFQEALLFAQGRNLPQTTAVKVYETRRRLEQQLAEVRTGSSLSADEQSNSVATLKADAMKTLSENLGDAFNDYLNENGQWLNEVGTVASDSSRE
jgi:hypothetical protein